MNKNAVYIGLSLFGLIIIGAYMALPKGIRNNNPTNIRFNSANAWDGQSGQDGTGFATFSSATLGIRAGAKLLRNYQRNSGLSSIREVLTRWAPSSENNTESYIKHVVQLTGIGADEFLRLQNEQVLVSVVSAIIKHENGINPYTDDVIAAGVALAFT